MNLVNTGRAKTIMLHTDYYGGFGSSLAGIIFRLVQQSKPPKFLS